MSGAALQRFNPSTQLPSHTGHFLVGGDVDDFELLGVKRRIGAEGEFAEITLLQLDKQLLVLRAEAFEHRRVYHDAELEVRLVALASFQNLGQLALNFHAHRERALHFAAAFAIGTIVVNGGADAFGMALFFYFRHADLRDLHSFPTRRSSD